MGTTSSTVALIKEHNPEGAWVEKPPPVRRTSRPGTAVHNHGRLAGRVATCFPVDEVAVADVQHPLVVRFYFGIEVAHVLGRLAQRRCEPEAGASTCHGSVKESTERLMSPERAGNTLGHMPYESAPEAFLSALSMRDFGRFAECLAPEVHARLLLPRGPEVRTGREEIARRFEGWFASASDFEVLDTQRTQIGLRTRLSWRFRMSRDGQSHEVVEQLAFVDAEPDGISAIDLVCSGFQREQRPVASGAVQPPVARGTR